MRGFFSAWHRKHPNAFLNKNNRNSILVKELAESFASAHFVEVRRDPVYVVQSLLNARKEVQGDSAFAWGLLSQDADSSSDRLSQIESVCRQVEAVERTMQQARSIVGPDQYWVIQYEEFCKDPKQVIHRLGEKFFTPDQWIDGLSGLQSFQCTNKQTLPTQSLRG